MSRKIEVYYKFSSYLDFLDWVNEHTVRLDDIKSVEVSFIETVLNSSMEVYHKFSSYLDFLKWVNKYSIRLDDIKSVKVSLIETVLNLPKKKPQAEEKESNEKQT